MSEPLLNVMKIMLLAGLYLFFVRVLWSVYTEMRDPRTVAKKRGKAATAEAGSSSDAVHATVRRRAQPMPVPAAAAPVGQPGGVATAVPAAIGQLMVLEPPNLAGVTYGLGSEITLGRAPTNGIALDDTYVSTVHARIFMTNGAFFIEDLASRNGSLLNGSPIVATTALEPGDRLQIGATLLEFA